MSTREALVFGQRALLINGLYVGSFTICCIPSIWKLISDTPLNELSLVGKGNANIMFTTSLWLGYQNIMLSTSTHYATVQNALFVNAFGFFMWFCMDLYHYKKLKDAYTKLFYVGLVPITTFSMLHSYYAANKMVNSSEDK